MTDLLPTPRKRRPRIGKYDQRPEIEKHLNGLPADAPIRALVAAPALDDRLKIYEDADADALKAQTRYKKWAVRALAIMAAATLISSLMLFPIEQLWPESAAWRGIVSGGQSVANAVALVVVWWLHWSGAVATWMQRRAEAERLRGDYFRALLLAPAPAGADAGQVWREKLALFDAAHLDYQRGYFESAEKRHRAAAGRSWARPVATLATGLGIGVGVLALAVALGAELPPWLTSAVTFILDMPTRWQLGFNTAASALLAYASARAMVDQDERNAALYAYTGRELDNLRTAERRAAVAAAAAKGDGGPVLAYAAEAQAILDTDHKIWLFNRPQANPTHPPPRTI